MLVNAVGDHFESTGVPQEKWRVYIQMIYNLLSNSNNAHPRKSWKMMFVISPPMQYWVVKKSLITFQEINHGIKVKISLGSVRGDFKKALI